MRANGDARGVMRRDKPVDGAPQEALAHRKVARKHNARSGTEKAREHGEHVFARVLRVNNIDIVFRAQPGKTFRRGKRVRGVQVEPEHAAAESLCLFRELSAVHIGKEAAVSLRGIRPHQVFNVFFRSGLSGIADEIKNVHLIEELRNRAVGVEYQRFFRAGHRLLQRVERDHKRIELSLFR